MFESTASLLANILWQQSLQVCILFLVLLGLTVCLRNMSANVRYVLWLLLIAKCVLPAIYAIPVPVLEKPTSIPSLSMAWGVVAHDSHRTNESMNLQSVTARSTEQPQQDEVLALNTLRSATEDSQTVTGSFESPPNTPSSIPTLVQLLVLGWLGIVIALTGRVIVKTVRINGELTNSLVPVDPEVTQAIDQLSTELALRPICVRTSTQVRQPFVWGWLRGTLYLPANFQKMGNAEQRRAILVHEVAHIIRWDAAANLLQTVVQILFFFHPLVWLANRRIRIEREKCCDEYVLVAARTNPTTYCDAIVEVLALGARKNNLAPLSLAVTGSMRNLENRITTILSADVTSLSRTHKLRWVLAICFACIALPLTFTLAQPAAEQGTDPTINTLAQAQEAEVSQEVSQGQMLFRAIDANTRQPLEEVTIELQYEAEGIAFDDVKTQKTNVKGESLITLPLGAIRSMRIYPTKVGYVPLRVYWEGQPSPKLPSTVTIRMHRGETIGGTLVSQANEPIVGADVWIHYWGKGHGHNPHIRVNICDDNYQSKGRTKTDAKGRWQLDELPADIEIAECHLYVAHPDYVSDRIVRATISTPVYDQPELAALKDQSAVIKLRKGEALQGIVMDGNSQPIADAQVFFDRYSGMSDQNPIAVTDQQGQFKIVSLDLEALREEERPWGENKPKRFTVVANGFANQKFGLSSPGRQIEIKLSPGHRVLGRVVDEQGNSIEKAWVSSQELRVSTETDASGNFQLSNVPAGSTVFSVHSRGYMAVERVELSTDNNGRHRIELGRPLRVHGQVLDADTGQPIESFKTWAGLDYGDGRAPQWSDWLGDKQVRAGGGYEILLNQALMSYRLRVQADGYMPMESELLDPTDKARRDIPLDFKLKKTDAKVIGRVLGLDHKPLAGAKVYLARQRLNLDKRKITFVDQFDSDFATTDATGKFEFPPEVEPYCIVVLHDTGLGLATETSFDAQRPIQLQKWNDKNHQQQIIRRPAPGQYVSFPK